jgi:hypothetical protein
MHWNIGQMLYVIASILDISENGNATVRIV